MSQVYLGNCGFVQLQRTADESGFIAKIVSSDYNNIRNRLSYDYVGSLGGGLGRPDDIGTNSLEMQYVPLISGDRVMFKRVEKDDRGEWVPSSENQQILLAAPGAPDNDFVAYVSVDAMYGMHFYDNFEDAVNNNKVNSLELFDSGTVPAEQYYRVSAGQSDAYRGIAGITNYNFTTTREAIDLTTLGKNYRRFYSNGLINGQGTLDCFWLFRSEECDDGCTDPIQAECESARYLAELILRLEEGAVFSGKFVLNQQSTVSSRGRSVFYQCDKCILTSVAVTVEPTQLVRARIDFITSGPFSLRYQFLPAYILTEEGLGRAGVDNRLLQENEDFLEIIDDELD